MQSQMNQDLHDNLQPPEEGHWNINYQILIEPVDADYNPAVRACCYQFTRKTDKRTTDYFNKITLCKFLGRYFYFGIAIDKKTEVIDLILGN
jgi:hypothetical protein